MENDLRAFLTENKSRITIAHIKEISFDLKLEYENLTGDNKIEKLIDLLNVVERENLSDSFFKCFNKLIKTKNIYDNHGIKNIQTVSQHTESTTKVDLNINEVVLSCINWSLKAPNPNGGMPSDDIGSESCSWASAGLLWGLLESGVQSSNFIIRKSLNWTFTQSNIDGGIPVVSKGNYSIVDASAQTLIATSYFNNSSFDDEMTNKINKLIHWILLNQMADGSWNWRPSAEFGRPVCTIYALLGLNKISRHSIISNKTYNLIDDSVKRGIEYLAISNTNGGWSATNSMKNNIAITVIVASGLIELEEYELSKIAYDYILKQFVKNEIKWPNFLDRPTGHTVTRFCAPYALRFLSFCSQNKIGDLSMNEQLINSAINSLMKHFDGDIFRYDGSNMCTWPSRDALLGLSAYLKYSDSKNK